MTLTLEFIAPTRPLSENEKRKMSHWGQWRRRLDPWKESTKAAWLQIPEKDRKAIKKIIEAQGVNVSVELPFKSKVRKDPHNYTGTTIKTIIDSLTTKVDKSGIVTWDGAWPDDTPEWVTVIDPIIVIGSDVAKVHLIPRG